MSPRLYALRVVSVRDGVYETFPGQWAAPIEYRSFDCPGVPRSTRFVTDALFSSSAESARMSRAHLRRLGVETQVFRFDGAAQ